MRVACVLVTHLRAKVELRNHPNLKETTAVIVDRSKGRPLVVDTFPAVVGVSPGMTQEQALSRQPGTIVLETDEPSYRKVFHRMLTALQGISDRVEGPELGTAYVRLDGLEGMYGGAARLVSALLHSVPEYLKPRVGLGEGKFPAFVAARVSKIQGATRVPSDAAAFLASHPIDLLPISSAVKTQMHRLGLHAMGQVASMRRDILADQFGPPGTKAWNLSRGIDNSPLIPLKYEESVVERTSLPFSSTSKELLLTAVDTLLKRAYSRPRMRGRYAGKAALCCTLLGEGGPLQADRGRLGEGGPHCQGPVGVRPPPGRRGGGGPYPLQPLLRCIGGADGALPGRPEGPAPAAGGGGAAAPGPHEREACPVQSGGRRPLASRAGDAHCAGSHRPFKRGRHETPFYAGPCGSSGGAGA